MEVGSRVISRKTKKQGIIKSITDKRIECETGTKISLANACPIVELPQPKMLGEVRTGESIMITVGTWRGKKLTVVGIENNQLVATPEEGSLLVPLMDKGFVLAKDVNVLSQTLLAMGVNKHGNILLICKPLGIVTDGYNNYVTRMNQWLGDTGFEDTVYATPDVAIINSIERDCRYLVWDQGDRHGTE